MKILTISQYYYPEQFRVNDICEELVKHGHEVTVITGLPNYSDGRVSKEYRWNKKRKENINGVDVIRCWEIGRGKRTYKLGLSYLSYMISSSLKVFFLKGRYDIIFGYQMSPVTQIVPGIIYKWKTSTPLFIYCCDIWPESVKSIFKDEKSIIYKLTNFISNKVYRSGNIIGVSSKPFKDYLNSLHGIEMNKMPYLPQHAEDTYLSTDFTPEDNGIVDFLFAGNVGIAQDIDCIIEACEINRDINNFKVHIVGDGSYLENSKKKVEEKNLQSIIKFHGRHPIEKMPEFYKIADACLLTLKASNLTGLTMPSKLQGYLAAGKPVIGAINGAAQEVIIESKCGACVAASDSLALAAAMKDFIENQSDFKKCGQNGRDYFKQNYTKEIFIKKLEKILLEMVE